MTSLPTTRPPHRPLLHLSVFFLGHRVHDPGDRCLASLQRNYHGMFRSVTRFFWDTRLMCLTLLTLKNRRPTQRTWCRRKWLLKYLPLSLPAPGTPHANDDGQDEAAPFLFRSPSPFITLLLSPHHLCRCTITSAAMPLQTRSWPSWLPHIREFWAWFEKLSAATPSSFAQAINTLQKDCRDEDPMIRGLALRSLCSLRCLMSAPRLPAIGCLTD